MWRQIALLKVAVHVSLTHEARSGCNSSGDVDSGGHNGHVRVQFGSFCSGFGCRRGQDQLHLSIVGI